MFGAIVFIDLTFGTCNSLLFCAEEALAPGHAQLPLLAEEE